MDYSTPFTFVTKDKNWIGKVAIGSLLVVTGIGFIPVLGWMLEITRRVIRNDSQPLPDWNNFGQYVVDGLKLTAVALIWSLPLVLVILSFAGAAAAFADQASDDTTFGLVLALLSPAAWGHLAETGSFGEAANPARAWALVGPHLGDFIVVGLLAWLASAMLSTVGTLLCLIGVFPATVYTFAIYGHLWGQLYRNSRPTSPPMTPLEGTAM